MALRNYRAPSRLTRPQQPATQPVRIPAPILGVNFYDSLARQGPEDAVYAFNVEAGAYGLVTRKGYTIHASGLGAAARTFIPFIDQSSADRLFVTTVNGIYNATSTGAVGTIEVSFPNQTGNAGWGNSTVYNNDGGDFFVIYADEVNGLFEYDVGTGTWAAKTDITGVADSDLVYVTEHKNRLWFVERGTMNAWYLGLGAKGGAATKFTLGNKFRQGGELKGIYRWSVDGGDGIDDFLVFVSSAGDVAVYQGSDPSSPSTWASIGSWNIGQVPAGRNIAHLLGGELHLLSVFGILSMQDLVQGVAIEKVTGQNSLSRRITRSIRADMATKREEYSWSLVDVNSSNLVVLVRPYDEGDSQLQYVFNFTTAGWTMWRGLPINCLVEWQGEVYFGDKSGNVHRMTGSLDGVDADGLNGEAVPFSFLSSFQDLGFPGMHKRVQMLRPTFFSETGNVPEYTARAVYDYDLQEGSLVFPDPEVAASAWDVGLWDEALWGGESTVETRLIGGKGIGFVCAVQVYGEVIDRTTFLDTVVYFEPGGMIG